MEDKEERLSPEVEQLLDRLTALTDAEMLRVETENGGERIIVSLAGSSEEEEYTFTKELFPSFLDEAESLTIDAENRYIRTRRRTFCLVHAESTKASVISSFYPKSLAITVNENISIAFRPKNLFVAIMATKKKAYDLDYLPPDDYPSVEITYSKPEHRLSPPEEDRLIGAFLFHLAAYDDVCFARSNLDLNAGFNPVYEYEGEEVKTSFSSLDQYNEAMELYLAAAAVTERELRYLSYYKVIEYFGPVVFRLERNEALRRKLDSPEAKKPDAEFLGSLYGLMASFKERSADERIPQVIIENCVDFIDLIQLLPPSLQKPFNYQTPKQEVESMVKNVGLAMYTTRNKVAHAKSNYTKLGTEVSGAEVEQFTKFLEQVALRAIQWYNRLPEHLKTTFKD